LTADIQRSVLPTGRVRWVQIDIDEEAEDLGHMITDEGRFRVAMGRQ
jgi:hypothetical protein